MYLVITIDLVETGIRGEDVKAVLDKFTETIQGHILEKRAKYELRSEQNTPAGKAEVR